MTERTVKVSDLDGLDYYNEDLQAYVAHPGRLERQVSVPWCTEHDSKMQDTICESYDLQSRRIGRNPFARKSKCGDGVVWKVLE